MNAESLKMQVGGDHYKNMAIQPIEYITKANLNFIQGCIVKYAARFKNKNGLEDIKKIVHYGQLGFDLYRDEKPKHHDFQSLHQYLKANSFTKTQANIVSSAAREDYMAVIAYAKNLAKIEYGEILY